MIPVWIRANTVIVIMYPSVATHVTANMYLGYLRSQLSCLYLAYYPVGRLIHVKVTREVENSCKH